MNHQVNDPDPHQLALVLSDFNDCERTYREDEDKGPGKLNKTTTKKKKDRKEKPKALQLEIEQKKSCVNGDESDTKVDDRSSPKKKKKKRKESKTKKKKSSLNISLDLPGMDPSFSAGYISQDPPLGDDENEGHSNQQPDPVVPSNLVVNGFTNARDHKFESKKVSVSSKKMKKTKKRKKKKAAGKEEDKEPPSHLELGPVFSVDSHASEDDIGVQSKTIVVSKKETTEKSSKKQPSKNMKHNPHEEQKDAVTPEAAHLQDDVAKRHHRKSKRTGQDSKKKRRGDHEKQQEHPRNNAGDGTASNTTPRTVMANNSYSIPRVEPLEGAAAEEDYRQDSIRGRPGAIEVRGLGRSGMGATIDEEEGSILYSNDDRVHLEYCDNIHMSSLTTDTNDHHLVVAELAEELEIVEGTPMDEDEHRGEEDIQEETRKRISCLWTLTFVVVCVGAVVALVLGLLYRASKNSNTATTIDTKGPIMSESPTSVPRPIMSESPTSVPSTTSVSPTTAPAMTPAQNLTELVIPMLSIYIPDIPNGAIQQKALDWLVSNDGVEGLIVSHDSDRLLDRFVLAILYFATNGEGWTHRYGWLSEESVCKWYIYGVIPICKEEDGRVGRLYFYQNNLQGTLPTELGALTTLSHLSLYWNNNLQGVIPTELGNLSALLDLNIVSNGLQDRIPTEIGNLTELRFLRMYHNFFEGQIPTELGNLLKLKTLYLDHNILTGNVPTELGSLTSLSHLNLSFNELRGSLPIELESFLEVLEECRLGCNFYENGGLFGIPDNCKFPTLCF